MRHLSTYKIFEAVQLFYHVSDVCNRKSIEKYGLDYNKGVSPWTEEDRQLQPYPKGNYMWKTIGKARWYAGGLSESMDIWEVKIDGLMDDPITAGGFYTKALIKPEFVRLCETVNEE